MLAHTLVPDPIAGDSGNRVKAKRVGRCVVRWAGEHGIREKAVGILVVGGLVN